MRDPSTAPPSSGTYEGHVEEASQTQVARQKDPLGTPTATARITPLAQNLHPPPLQPSSPRPRSGPPAFRSGAPTHNSGLRPRPHFPADPAPHLGAPPRAAFPG
ncbi:hypothetical protein GCM10010344_13340 [Streptomyces bluensis]|nr:hypothetical protein GCM10010344_13340 [Streptomyces bluensis]